MMAMELRKGQKADLTKTNPNLKRVVIGLGWQNGGSAAPEIDTAAFLLGASGKASGDEAFIFYGNTRHITGSVEHVGSNLLIAGADREQLQVNLQAVPGDVERIAFTATIYDPETRRQSFGQVRDAYIRILDDDSETELLRFPLDNFTVETAIVAGELYRYKGEWKFNAIGAGYSGGLAALCGSFGIVVSEGQGGGSPAPAPQPVPPRPAPPPPNAGGGIRIGSGGGNPAPQGNTGGGIKIGRGSNTNTPPAGGNGSGGGIKLSRNNPPPLQDIRPPQPPIQDIRPPQESRINLKKVELRKGQKVSLTKKDGALGEISINLNWHQGVKQQNTGFFASLFGGNSSGDIDLDLGCLYELKNGRKGAVQALGNSFGSLQNMPYIALDGDDRTGSVEAGETLRVNGARVSDIKRILVYTFIYEGVANWQQADGVVTVRCPGSPDIIVRMDEYGSSRGMCAIAMLENVGGTFSVEKLVKFFNGHRDMDAAFHWGLDWVRGSKD